MKHPNQGVLALHAGGDLGYLARWRTARHLAKCERCREDVAALERARRILPELSEIPEVPWNRLAAEMKANIRLGLAAGECVRGAETPLRDTPLFTGLRTLVAFSSIVVLVVTGLVLERPAPLTAKDDGTVIQATGNGIQIREGGRAFRLVHAGTQNVTAGAQGSMRDSYVDPETGYVTINNVYAE